MDSEVLSYNIVGNKRNLLCGIMDSYLNPTSKTVVMYPHIGVTSKAFLRVSFVFSSGAIYAVLLGYFTHLSHFYVFFMTVQ